MNKAEQQKFLKAYLEEKYFLYNSRNFIEKDPISIPHRFSKKQDIEISGFLAATIAWGNRKSIIQNALELMRLMDFSPHAFITQASKKDLRSFSGFVHRTFNSEDCIFFISALAHLYKKQKSLEYYFSKGILPGDSNIKNGIIQFRNDFFSIPHPARTQKHVSNPDKNSSSKRLCMFLRWMVRNDRAGVDFGIWKNISPAMLCLPLDVHTGNVSRKLGILARKQNDWKAVEEVSCYLKVLDPLDPVKYDFALFGVGINENLP